MQENLCKLPFPFKPTISDKNLNVTRYLYSLYFKATQPVNV